MEFKDEAKIKEILWRLKELDRKFREIMRELSAGKVSKDYILKEALPTQRRICENLLNLIFELYGRKNVTADNVKSYIYNYKGWKTGRYVKWFFDLLDIDKLFDAWGAKTEEDELETLNLLLAIAITAWNIFPKMELDGKSPLELAITGEKAPGFDEDEESRPLFENILYLMVENNYLDVNVPSALRKQIYNEKGNENSFNKFRKWFLGRFKVELNKKQIELANYVALKAWQFYPHKVLGDKSPLQIKIENTKHCEEKGCSETQNLYICEECGKILCFVHSGVHVIENKRKPKPHDCRLISDYIQRVNTILSSLHRDEGIE
ncbi:MAG: hypothetical protein QXO49_06735 [Candidatus Bathyarchaeia archaeon]